MNTVNAEGSITIGAGSTATIPNSATSPAGTTRNTFGTFQATGTVLYAFTVTPATGVGLSSASGVQFTISGFQNLQDVTFYNPGGSSIVLWYALGA